MNLKQKTKVKKWRHSNPLNGVPVKKYGNVVYNEDTYIYLIYYRVRRKHNGK